MSGKMYIRELQRAQHQKVKNENGKVFIEVINRHGLVAQVGALLC
jgi:hypothetical protein